MMWGRTTRLEFIIVTVAFLVLLLCSRPPRPGSAYVDSVERSLPRPQDIETPMLPDAEPNAAEPVELVQPAFQEVETTAVEAAEPLEPAYELPRLATVDARNCQGLGYNDVMQGEVTVRMVWDGQKLVPQTVCVVKEPSGITSVWRFDEEGQAVLSEIEPSQDPLQ